jgi:glycosyltransferase involved in cell wall biosynthesis
MPSTVAIILKGYPRLSETFIAQEIRALELRGFRICLFSLRHPTDPAIHPIHAEIEASVNYLPEYVIDDIPRVINAWWQVRKLPGYRQAKRMFVRDLRRDFSINRIRRFAQAMVLAHDMPSSVRHYYAHFMHTPASVTYYASLVNQTPWSISAHAKDIWTIEDWEKREKISSARWVVTCTAVNAEHLRKLSDRDDKVTLLYHGLDFNRFPVNNTDTEYRNGSDVRAPVRLISVGRAVEKKGYRYLLEALVALPQDMHWEFIHIGGGELFQKLRADAEAMGLSDRVNWLGGLPQTEVLAHYRRADLFVLPSIIAADGDRDGLPNVLMEAQSQGLACLSTDISGIPELIDHAKTGWLVAEKNSAALREALVKLITEPELRSKLAQAGMRQVRQNFSLDYGIDRLVEKLQPSVNPGSK